jgi:hypothetical protein
MTPPTTFILPTWSNYAHVWWGPAVPTEGLPVCLELVLLVGLTSTSSSSFPYPSYATII